MNAGQIKVNVTLPKFQNQRFSAFSRQSPLAKWGAAKAAVMHLKRRTNVFIPTSHSDTVKRFENIIRDKQLTTPPIEINHGTEQSEKDRTRDDSFRIL